MEELDHDEILKKKYLARAPGDAATKAYIASRYLSGSNSKDGKKKRKKSSAESSRSNKKQQKYGNIGIIDEEDTDWKTSADDKIKSKQAKEEQAKLQQEAIDNAGGVFKGASNNWETIRQGELEEQQENSDEEPVIVEQQSRQQQQRQDDGIPRMSNGQRAGVLTKAEIKAEAEKARDVEKRAMERLKRESQGGDAETIYRDASGRKIDLKMKRAEEARIRKEQIEKEARRMEWGKGLVQRREAEEAKRKLEEEKNKPMARYANDEDLNEELKEKERWNDPAAGFLTKKTSSESKGKRLVRPSYKGPWKPNRFMIPPGHRWDGVDRSTGYEDEFFLLQNASKSRAAEAHAWSTEDM